MATEKSGARDCGDGRDWLVRYRYLTPALRGPWRDSREAAVRDALVARQAAEEPGQPDGLRWLIPGRIEERADSGA